MATVYLERATDSRDGHVWYQVSRAESKAHGTFSYATIAMSQGASYEQAEENLRASVGKLSLPEGVKIQEQEPKEDIGLRLCTMDLQILERAATDVRARLKTLRSIPGFENANDPEWLVMFKQWDKAQQAYQSLTEMEPPQPKEAPMKVAYLIQHYDYKEIRGWHTIESEVPAATSKSHTVSVIDECEGPHFVELANRLQAKHPQRIINAFLDRGDTLDTIAAFLIENRDALGRVYYSIDDGLRDNDQVKQEVLAQTRAKTFQEAVNELKHRHPEINVSSTHNFTRNAFLIRLHDTRGNKTFFQIRHAPPGANLNPAITWEILETAQGDTYVIANEKLRPKLEALEAKQKARENDDDGWGKRKAKRNPVNAPLSGAGLSPVDVVDILFKDLQEVGATFDALNQGPDAGVEPTVANRFNQARKALQEITRQLKLNKAHADLIDAQEAVNQLEQGAPND